MESLPHSSLSPTNDIGRVSLNMDSSPDKDEYVPVHQIRQSQDTRQPCDGQSQQLQQLEQHQGQKKSLPSTVGEEQRRVSFQTDDKLQTIYIIRNEIDDMDISESSMSSFTRQMFVDRSKHFSDEIDNNHNSSRSFEFADDDDSDESYSDSDDESVEKYYSCMEYEDDEDIVDLQHNDDIRFHFPGLSTTAPDDPIITTRESNNKDDESLHSITNDSTEGGCDFSDEIIDDDDDDIDDDFADDDDVFESVAKMPPMRNFAPAQSNTVQTITANEINIAGTASVSNRKRPLNLTISSARIRDELDDVSHRTSHQRFSPYLTKGDGLLKDL
jgi:hypothetical protein